MPDIEDFCADIDCEFLMARGGCELGKTPDECIEVREAECEGMRDLLWEARHDEFREEVGG